MNTPIYDFAKTYRDLRPARFHMPGHKGRGPLGCEDLDLTEIPGADSLYEAAGIIAESEANASALFGCPTFYSTEGSSHCIRAMLLLAKQLQAVGGGVLDAPRVSARDAATGNRQQATGNRSRGSGNGEQGTGTGGERTATAGMRRPEVRPPYSLAMTGSGSFRVLAARNVHRAFLTAAALLDLDLCWLPNTDGSYLSAAVTQETLDAALAETGARAVYLSCPDYLGLLPDLRPLAEVCHARGALLLVDNAHGAYLRFLSPSRHPMDLGADLCCDSAHKTLPVLTGGAYLHVAERLGMQSAKCKMQDEATGNRQQATGAGSCEAAGNRQQATDPPVAAHSVRHAVPRSDEASVTSHQSPGDAATVHYPLSTVNCQLSPGDRGCETTGNRQQATGASAVGAAIGRPPEACTSQTVRNALALFGSTSPSYLILQSLDLANPYLETLPERLAAFLPRVEALKARLQAAGWRLIGDEPLKLTLDLRLASEAHAGTSIARPLSGVDLAAALEREGIFCEFADPDFAVFMLSPQNTEAELDRLEQALIREIRPRQSGASRQIKPLVACHLSPVTSPVCSVRTAMLAPAETVPASESLGRVLARPGVSCPPAVPILMPGERITETDIAAFERYGIETVCVLF